MFYCKAVKAKQTPIVNTILLDNATIYQKASFSLKNLNSLYYFFLIGRIPRAYLIYLCVVYELFQKRLSSTKMQWFRNFFGCPFRKRGGEEYFRHIRHVIDAWRVLGGVFANHFSHKWITTALQLFPFHPINFQFSVSAQRSRKKPANEW